MMMCSHHLCLVLNLSITPKKKKKEIPCLASSCSHSYLVPGPGKHPLCYVSIDLPILDMSCKWSHAICDLLCWLFSLSMFLRFIYLVCVYLTLCHSLFIHLLRTLKKNSDGHLGCFYFLAVVNGAAMNMCVYIFIYLFSVF